MTEKASALQPASTSTCLNRYAQSPVVTMQDRQTLRQCSVFQQNQMLSACTSLQKQKAGQAWHLVLAMKSISMPGPLGLYRATYVL